MAGLQEAGTNIYEAITGVCMSLNSISPMQAFYIITATAESMA